MPASNGRAAVKSCLKSAIKIEDKSIKVFKNTKRQTGEIQRRLSIGCNPKPKVIEHIRLISQRSLPIS
jgi:hypothetical protein